MAREIIKFNKEGQVTASVVEVKKDIEAPYVEPEISMLGDLHLDPVEAVKREREDLLRIRHKREKIHGQEELDKADRSRGTRLYYSEFLTKLQRIVSGFFVKDGSPGQLALYVPKTESEIIRDGYDLTHPQWHNESKYVTGFPKDWLPEWGHILNDTDGIGNREVRGWRSILIALIKQKVISYTAAINEFGDPVEDQRSKFWYEQLHQLRNV